MSEHGSVGGPTNPSPVTGPVTPFASLHYRALPSNGQTDPISRPSSRGVNAGSRATRRQCRPSSIAEAKITGLALGLRIAQARAIMQTLRALGLLSLVAAAACGSSSGSGTVAQATDPASPTACTTAEDCNPQECVCTDGETFASGTVCSGGSCLTGSSDAFCASACKSAGARVSSIRPARNVATSPECDAWCSKGASLGCGSATCNRFFFCGVPKGSCEAATRAALKCATDDATWACSTHSASWSVTSSCGTFAALCDGADATSAPSR